MSRRGRSRRDDVAADLLERLRVVAEELESIQATAEDAEVGGVVGNINMALSYVTPSISYLEN
jgi:hypothetical protein